MNQCHAVAAFRCTRLDMEHVHVTPLVSAAEMTQKKILSQH